MEEKSLNVYKRPMEDVSDEDTEFTHAASKSPPRSHQTRLHNQGLSFQLSRVCTYGHFEKVKLLLTHENIDIENGGIHGEEAVTHLHRASGAGHHRIVQLLLDHGANIDAQTSKTSMSALSLTRV